MIRQRATARVGATTLPSSFAAFFDQATYFSRLWYASSAARFAGSVMSGPSMGTGGGRGGGGGGGGESSLFSAAGVFFSAAEIADDASSSETTGRVSLESSASSSASANDSSDAS